VADGLGESGSVGGWAGGSGALLSSKKNQNFKSVDRNLI